MKKITGFISMLLCTSFLLASCGKPEEAAVSSVNELNDANVTEPGELPIVKDKIELNVGMIANPNVQDFDTNAFTMWLEEKTNIHLNFTMFPSNEAMEKVRLMISSDSELPEVLFHFPFSDVENAQYGQDGIFYDMREMIEKKSYWINEMFETTEDKDLKKMITSIDGKMYYIPEVVEQTGNYYGMKAWINKTWLDKLGLDVPQTTDELETVLKAFAEQDPNGNGKKDEIPFTGAKNGWNTKPWVFLMNSFVYTNGGNMLYVDDDGKLQHAYMQDEFREGLKYMNKLADEGLYDIQSFTQDYTVLKSLAQNVDASIVGVFAAGSPDTYFPSGTERLGEYTALPPLKGPEGVGYAVRGTGTMTMGGVITKYCKNKLAAFRLMDFMMSEEASLFARYGKEGVDWFKAEPGDRALFESIGAEPVVRDVLSYTGIQNEHWQAYHPNYRNARIANGQIWDGNELNGEYVKAKALEKYVGKGPEKLVRKILLDNNDQEEYSQLNKDISTYISENIALFITGRKDIDMEWDGYIKELNNMGEERLLELAQKGYDAFNNLE